MKTIGRAGVDFDKFNAWYNSDSRIDFYKTENLWTPYLYKLHNKQFNLYDLVSSGHIIFMEREMREVQEYISAVLSDVSRPFDLLYKHEVFVIIQFGKFRFLLPADSDFLFYDIFQDYSDVPVGQILSSNPVGTGLVSSSNLATLSYSDQVSKIDSCNDSIAAVQSNMEDIRQARTDDLAALQAEIDAKVAELNAKKEALMAELSRKKAELDEQKVKLEQQLFILESQIYTIRCYLGEVIDFKQIRSGITSKVDSPIVVFQKLRYLDEELGKMTSIYDFDFSDVKYFEQFIKYNPEAFDTFCPSDKCVSLVRVSRSNVGYVFSNTDYGCMLEMYEKLHGKRIAILIRNGENLYIGWTDEEKVKIEDNLFYTPKVYTVADSEEVSEKPTTPEEYVSRIFVFSVLQGLLDNNKLISIPEKSQFMKPSKYIIWSSADGWLEDNRWGSFDDILNKTQGHYRVGNVCMAFEALRDGRYDSSWRGYSYERDRNYSRRTGDCHLSDGEIVKLNIVENATVIDHYEYKIPAGTVHRTSSPHGKAPAFDTGVEILSITQSADYDLYVSLRKLDSDSKYVYYDGQFKERKREARANFRVYSDEILDLTFLNSVWIKYIITTRKLGGRFERNNYSHMIKYLNIALQYLVKREREERDLIAEYYPEIDLYPDWQVVLSEWKLSKDVFTITPYQAKRFAKYLEVYDAQ